MNRKLDMIELKATGYVDEGRHVYVFINRFTDGHRVVGHMLCSWDNPGALARHLSKENNVVVLVRVPDMFKNVKNRSSRSGWIRYAHDTACPRPQAELARSRVPKG